jgi:hypothetical protein
VPRLLFLAQAHPARSPVLCAACLIDPLIQCFPFVQRKDGSVRVHWKGASEIVLGLCTAYLDSDNQVHELTPEKVQELQGEIQRMAEASLRTLCLAYRELDPSDVPAGDLEQWTIPEEGLICMAIVGIKVGFQQKFWYLGVTKFLDLLLRGRILRLHFGSK